VTPEGLPHSGLQTRCVTAHTQSRDDPGPLVSQRIRTRAHVWHSNPPPLKKSTAAREGIWDKERRVAAPHCFPVEPRRPSPTTGHATAPPRNRAVAS
jgi:hypothetical protein